MRSPEDVLKLAVDTIKAAALVALENASDDIQSSGRDVVRDWQHKVDFTEDELVTPDYFEITVKPTGRNKQIFQYVDKGTKGVYLIPKFVTPGKMLRFQAGYSARTAPVAQWNRGTGQHFGSWVSKAQIAHPGIKPRLFLETFAKELSPTLQVRVQSAVNRVI